MYLAATDGDDYTVPLHIWELQNLTVERGIGMTFDITFENKEITVMQKVEQNSEDM